MADFSKGTISKNEMQNYKLNVEELKDKVRRFNPLKNGADLEFLNKELATENNRLNFWNNNQRESAINATKERISLIEGRVRSLKNTENMYNLDSKQLNYLNQKFDDEVKKYPNMNVSKPQEILDLRQEVINGYNTKMIITSKTKLMQQLKANLALVSSDSEKQYLESQIAELQEDIDRGLPMNNTRRLRELNRAKEVATSQGRMDIVAEYIKEIKEIEANYDASNQEEDMKKWAMDRVIELQKSEIIADRVGDRHIIKNYQREIEDLKAKYNLTLTTPELEDINRYKPYEMTSETNKDDKAREEAMNYYRKMGLFPETEKEGKSK